MKILFKNAETIDRGVCSVAVENEKIVRISEKPIEEKGFDRVLDLKGKLLIPGFYNTHCHAAMTLFRGYGEDMPLHKWLDDRILPAEEHLTDRSVYWASMTAIAEMLRNGIVSFSDMYFFCRQTALAAAETGIKANLSRSIVSFDEKENPRETYRFLEAVSLAEEWHNAENGRILVDMAPHAEYSNTAPTCRAIADFAREKGLGVQVHVSETKSEHEEGIARRGMTPLAFFDSVGLLDNRTTAAHCVWVSEEDMELMVKKNVTVSHNPVSNLKLASGIAPVTKMLEKGVRVAIGTDGVASNNSLDLMRDMNLASLLSKGTTNRADAIPAREIFRMATENGALAQGRQNCGLLEVGYDADLVVVDLDRIHNIPSYDPLYTLLFSANSSDVVLTMVGGRILYENGEYPSLDIEKVKYEMRDVVSHYFD